MKFGGTLFLHPLAWYCFKIGITWKRVLSSLCCLRSQSALASHSCMLFFCCLECYFPRPCITPHSPSTTKRLQRARPVSYVMANQNQFHLLEVSAVSASLCRAGVIFRVRCVPSDVRRTEVTGVRLCHWSGQMMYLHIWGPSHDGAWC